MRHDLLYDTAKDYVMPNSSSHRPIGEDEHTVPTCVSVEAFAWGAALSKRYIASAS